MQTTYYSYLGFAYGLPFGTAAFLFGICTVINKRANAFIAEHVLGIKLKSNKNEKKTPADQTSPNSASNKNKITEICHQLGTNITPEDDSKGWKANVDTFLYIDQTETQHGQKPLPCIWRFLCDLFSSAILTVLLEIIYQKCVLAYQSIVVGDPCPDFTADCFGTYNGTIHYGPLQCIPGQNASFPFSSRNVNCYGWLYQDISADKVLDAVGVSGGLLGLVSCIVPLVYYVSYFRKRFRWMSVACVILPMTTIGCFIALILRSAPEVVSILTIITFALLIFMTVGGWLWAVISSFANSDDEQGDDKHDDDKHGGNKCCCVRSYKNYPCCCCFGSNRENAFCRVQVSP